MDEPPTATTLISARACLLEIEARRSAAVGDTQSLLASMAAAMTATIDRHVLFVYTVPHLVAACELLASGGANRTSIEGCRYELDTLTPLPSTIGAPDVPLSALSRGAKRDTRD